VHIICQSCLYLNHIAASFFALDRHGNINHISNSRHKAADHSTPLSLSSVAMSGNTDTEVFKDSDYETAGKFSAENNGKM
jgi:hypothetical protein